MQIKRILPAIIALIIIFGGYWISSRNQESPEMSDAIAESSTIKGDCQTVFGGEICTYGRIEDGNVVEFGATVPVATAANAPLDAEMVFPPITYARIPLPAEIQAATGINHLSVNWEAHGHPPEPFLTPHFDFHFNTMNPDEIEAIDCADPVRPESLPDGYVMPDEEVPGFGTLVGLCVPTMGMHALSATDASAEGLFKSTMIVGYHDQEVIFVEPMIARETLMNKANFATTVPEVAFAGEGVMWPNSFEAVYDAATDSYRFAFSL